jgi:hypothetical protein
MVLSAILSLLLVREVSWTIDELSWISLSPEFGFGQAFSPYVGHLIAIPRLIYWAVLEINGTGDYWVFRVLTLLSVFLMVALLFVWLKRRVPVFVALAFCLVLAIFPVDHLHYLAGNGVAIALALAFGLAALIFWDRDDPTGDIWAFVFLILGMLTYTVAVPFAIGLVVAALIGRSDRRRIWVGAVPLVLYGLWRLLEGSGGIESETGSIEWGNILLLPAWTFQSVGSILSAMTGLGFDFSKIAGGPADTQGLILGPVLATLAALGLAWRFSRGPMPSGFWVTGAILIALLASQVVVWGTLDARDPGAPRYLMPGAVMVVLVIAEVLRKIDIGRVGFTALWVLAATGITMSLGIMARNTEWLGTAADSARAEVTAIEILETARRAPLPAIEQPRDSVRSEYEAGAAGTYGYLGLNREGIEGRPDWVGKKIDAFLVESLRIGLRPVDPAVKPKRCRQAAGPLAPGDTRVVILSPGAIFRSDATVSLALGRFASWPSIPLGEIEPGAPKRLWLPFDGGIPIDKSKQQWYIQATGDAPGSLADLEICKFE